MHESPASTDPAARRRRRPLAFWLLILVTVSSVLIPVGLGVARPEVARWHVARANEALLDGQIKLAEASLERALGLSPNSYAAHFARARLQAARGNVRLAIEDLEQTIQLALPRARIEPLATKASLQQAAGQFRQAVDTWKEIAELADPNNVQILNGLAYARALAAIELDEALSGVQEALRLYRNARGARSNLLRRPPESQGADGRELTMIDTRGLIYLERGELKEARHDFDTIDQQFDQWVAGEQQALRLYRETQIDIRQLPSMQRNLNRTVAVVLYHRALVLAAQNEATAALRLFQRVRQRGYQPGPDLH